MGIGTPAFGVFEEILKEGQFLNCKSVIELGSQDIAPEDQVSAKKLLKKINNVNFKDNKDVTAKEFYNNIGFREYACIDADGKHEALKFDLNKNILKNYNFDNKFDLVTNFGTSEHLIGQMNFFENMHNLTNQNGYIFNLLPFEGYFNHGYFNYHPKFFYDLAIFNNYQIIGFWYISQRFSLNFLHYRGRHYKPLEYNNDLIKFLDQLAVKRKFFTTPLNNTSDIAVLYKKNDNNNFNCPFDSSMLLNNKLEGYSIKNPENYQKMFNRKIDHNKQIENILGDTYWKIKIKKVFRDKNYRRILFRKLIFDNNYQKLLISRFFRMLKYFFKFDKLLPWTKKK